VIADYILPITGNSPASPSTANPLLTGDPIDTRGFHSADFFVQSGATDTSNATVSLAGKVQHSADGSTGWADYTDPTTGNAAAIAAITSVNSKAAVGVSLVAANRYIRTVLSATLSAGKVFASSSIILGSAEHLPPSQ